MLRPLIAALALLAAAFAPVPAARAQQDPLAGFTDPVGELQRLVGRTPDDRRADLILGRALGETEPVPAGVAALDFVALLVPGDPEWDAAAAWAAGQPQRAALDALREATDRRSDNAFGLPYGTAAPADLQRLGFWVELVDGKVYQPEFHYFEVLERLDTLVWIEANRLAAEGEGMEAAELLASMVRLGRMLADRPTFMEAASGYALMLDTCERLRDLVYRHPKMLDARDTKRAVRLLEDRTLRLDRLRFPEGGEIAVKQAILDTFERQGAADLGAVASLLDLPEPGADAEAHADYYESVDAVKRVFGDWRLRWPLDVYDVLMRRPSYYASLSTEPAKHAVVLGVALPHDVLFSLRLALRAELSGTRLGLGAIAYGNDFGDWPKPLVATRPAYVTEIDVDPYDPRQADQMRYFVPIRDQSWGPRETPHPHRVNVHVALGDQGAESLVETVRHRLIADAAAVGSAQAFIGAMTQMGIEPGNRDQRIAATEPASLKRLVPPHLSDVAGSLEAESLRAFADVMVKTAMALPEYPELREAFRQDDDPRGRRRSSRGRGRDSGVSRELTAASRQLAVAQSRVGVPLARRLSQDTGNDPDVAVFDVELTEKDFVIYSVGDDGVADWAEQSGLDGTDLLYWPPVLSLYREHVGG